MSLLEIPKGTYVDGVTVPVFPIPATPISDSPFRNSTPQSKTNNKSTVDVSDVVKETISQLGSLGGKKEPASRTYKDEAFVDDYTKTINGKRVHVQAHKRNLRHDNK